MIFLIIQTQLNMISGSPSGTNFQKQVLNYPQSADSSYMHSSCVFPVIQFSFSLFMSCGQLPPDPKWYPSTCYNYDHKKFLLEHGTFPEDSAEISVVLLILGRRWGRLWFFNILCALECVSPNNIFQMRFLINVHVYIPGTQYVKKGGLTWTPMVWFHAPVQYPEKLWCNNNVHIGALYHCGSWLNAAQVSATGPERRKTKHAFRH